MCLQQVALTEPLKFSFSFGLLNQPINLSSTIYFEQKRFIHTDRISFELLRRHLHLRPKDFLKPDVIKNVILYENRFKTRVVMVQILRYDCAGGTGGTERAREETGGERCLKILHQFNFSLFLIIII